VPALRNRAARAPQQGGVFLDRLEIAEGIAEDGDAIELAVAQTALARIALEESHLGPRRPRPLPRQFDEIMRHVDAGQAAEPAARQFNGMPPLAAAKVEYTVIRRKIDAGDHCVDIRLGVCGVLEDVTIGLEIEIVEDLMPPVGPDMALKVGDPAERNAHSSAPQEWALQDRVLADPPRGRLPLHSGWAEPAASGWRRTLRSGVGSLGFMNRHQVVLLKQ